MHPTVKKIIPFLAGIILFYGLSALFFAPEVFEGKVIQQVDSQQVEAMSREARELYKKDGKVRQWTNTIFSGMPTVMIFQKNKGNLIRHFNHAMLLWQDMKSPSIQLFVTMFAMFLALLLLGVDWRIALLGGIGMGMGTYNMELLEAGHATKMVAIAYFSLIAASAWYTYNKNLLLGASLFALTLGMQIYSNHYQITYYSLMVLVVLGIVEFVKALRTGTWAHFAKATLLLIGFGILSAAANASKIWPTYEYSEETIRGKTDLTSKKVKDGLSEDYAFSWSYGISETMTLLVPDFMGGGGSQTTYKNTETYKAVAPQIRASQAKRGITGKELEAGINQQVGSLMYSGDQAFVGMGVYMGIVIFFLMLLGVVLDAGPRKWWLVAAMLFMLTIAWGGNFFLNKIWFHSLPMFNKFRSHSMSLALVQALAVILAALGLQDFFRKDLSDSERMRALKIAGGVTVGILLIVLVGSSMFDYSAPRDKQFGQLAQLLEKDRLSLLRKDALRSLVFALVGIGILYFYTKRRLSALVTTLALLALVTVDMWTVARRIINPLKFKTPKSHVAALEKTAADQQILQDKDLHYRVLDLANGDPFRNAFRARFHKMTGGYHPAKLMRYQDLIEKYLSKPGQYTSILGMLNNKYIIQRQGNQEVVIPLREKALGNAWFVPSFRILESADKELEELGNINPRQEAIFDKAYAKALEGFNLNFDSTATIRLTAYDPDVMEYEYSASTPQLAVFSEIYYPEKKGWSLTVNGKRIPILKADYLLRAAVLPAGQNQKLIMKFHPRSYYLGETLSLIASIVLLLALAAGFYFAFKDRQTPDLYSLPETAPPAKPEKTQAPALRQKGKKKRKK